VRDKLPEIRKDPSYLQKQRMRVFSGAGEQELDPSSIDWSNLSAKNFPYRLRQDPGTSNALGKVKFMFPNPFNVYLHDTPSRELFDKPERAFSSGCIRVEHPLDLAEYLLAKHEGWSRQKIEATVDAGREQTVMLKEPVQVHIQYWTAWVDNGGRVNFRKDVYGRDVSLADAMGQPAPTSL
jgi:murein L,D-transpeptidase YcbB/YkuD